MAPRYVLSTAGTALKNLPRTVLASGVYQSVAARRVYAVIKPILFQHGVLFEMLSVP